MPVMLVCSAGHRWEPAGRVACPVCGESDHPTGSRGSTVDSPQSGGAGTAGRGGGQPTLSANRSHPPAVPGAPAVDGYAIVEELGRGGMGVVYLAVNERLARVEVIKTVRAGIDAGDETLARFRAEADAVARLRHENIVQVHRAGTATHGGVRVPYMALEFLEGGSLDRKIAGTPRPAREAAELVEKIARAVHCAHRAGVVHRDLKPSNILLTGDGVPKVADFGIAKLADEDSGRTRTGSVLGTPSYMAPEQARGDTKRIGPAADVYGLGTILYECLTGRPPFRTESRELTLRQVIHDEPVPPGALNPAVPRDLETVCLKCLAKEPERRYATAEELADDLRRFLGSEPVLARPPGWWVRFRLWCRRPERIRDAGAFMVFFGVVSTLWSLTGMMAVATGGVRTTDWKLAEVQIAGLIAVFYLPKIWIGLGTMSRRRLWLWGGVIVAAADCVVAIGVLAGFEVLRDLTDVGGMYRDPNVRIPVVSLLGILMGMQFLGYCVALVSYYSNPDAVE